MDRIGMSIHRACTMGLVLVCLCGGVSARAEKLTIAEDGRTQYVIVLSEEADETGRHAAVELTHFLQQVTGAEFKIESKSPLRKERVIAVGPGAARRIAPQIDLDGLGAEGVVIVTKGKNLILTGGDDATRGTLYAVYTFLEEQVGCRWWSSEVSTIPEQPTLKIGRLNLRHVPQLEYRETFYLDAFNGDWAARNKTNGHAARLDAKRGGKHFYEGFVHTFYSLIGPGKYFAKHPEWFSEIAGERTHKNGQLCLTNEEMRAELVRNLKARLRKNRVATIASVSQNYCQGHCQCSRCAAVDAEEGSPAGSLLRFVNAVASDIEEEFPHVAVSTLAYGHTRKPPRHVRPRHNVIVQLCSTDCSFSRPLTDPQNRGFHNDVVGWSKICNRIYIWDFATNLSNHLLPHPNLRVLGPNIRFFADHKVKGLFTQGAYCTSGAEMAELRAWVLAKLLWNPTLDAQKLIDEFLDGYYGLAGRHIGEYLKLTHDAAGASEDRLGVLAESPPRFLSYDLLAGAWEHLTAAEEAVKDDVEIRDRVHVAQLPMMCAFLLQWANLRAEASGTRWPTADSIEAAYERFTTVARHNGVTRLSESRRLASLEEDIRRQQDLLKRRRVSVFPPMRFFPLSPRVRRIDGMFPGQWRFALDPDNRGEQAGWYKVGYDDSEWAQVPVPLFWEQYPMGKGYDGVAWYRVAIDIPEQFAEKNVFLSFEGVDEEAWVYLNGKCIGERTVKSTGKTQAEFWDNPFELPLANARYGGMNTLAVKVRDDAYAGGIFKPVSFIIKER